MEKQKLFEYAILLHPTKEEAKNGLSSIATKRKKPFCEQ